MKIDFEIKGLKIAAEGEISEAVTKVVDELAATAEEGLKQLRAELKAKAAHSVVSASTASE